jgi:hypothetical protein
MIYIYINLYPTRVNPDSTPKKNRKMARGIGEDPQSPPIHRGVVSVGVPAGGSNVGPMAYFRT